MIPLHHAALCPSDVDASLRFYRDGIGLSVLADFFAEGDWPTVFQAGTNRLRSVMLGDPTRRDAGVLELVVWDGADLPAHGREDRPATGFFLLSFYTDVSAATQRLTELGFERPVVVEHVTPSARMLLATVRDPDGVLVELIDVLGGSLPADAGD